MPTDDRRSLYDQITTRGAEIASRCAVDMTVDEIADDLDLGRSTVDDHIRHVYPLLGADAKRDVAGWWRAEKEAYIARLLERLLIDDAS